MLLLGSPRSGEAEETSIEPGEPAVEEESEQRPNPLGPPFGEGFFHVSHIQARVNPIGLSWASETGHRWFLFDSDHLLLRSARLDVGLDGRLNPASASAGPYVELVPLAFLKLRVSLRPTGYFGVFGSIFQFESVDDDWSADRMREIGREHAGDPAVGLVGTVKAAIQVKVGPVIALFENLLEYTWMNVDRPYFEPLSYFLVEPSDGIWTMSSTVGVVLGPGSDDWFLVVGARHDRLRALSQGWLRHLVGGVLLWQMPESFWAWGRPQLAVLVQGYVEDDWREGQVYGGMQLSLQF